MFTEMVPADDLRCLRRCSQLLTDQYLLIVGALEPQMSVPIYLTAPAVGPRRAPHLRCRGPVPAQTPAIRDQAISR